MKYKKMLVRLSAQLPEPCIPHMAKHWHGEIIKIKQELEKITINIIDQTATRKTSQCYNFHRQTYGLDGISSVP